jgi:cytochrome c oxidase cbb3-type subunit 1
MFLTGALIMVYNLWMTVRAQPQRVVAYAGVPAE